jgi:glyoxylase I family protein
VTAPVWSHIALNCADEARTEQFYTRWFGFSRARAVPVGASEIVFLRCGSVLLELFSAAPSSTAPVNDQDGPHTPGTIRHIAFQTDDVDAFVARMGDAAAVTLGPIDFDNFIHGWRTVWLRDPDGVVVEVSQGYRDENSPRRDSGSANEDDTRERA